VCVDDIRIDRGEDRLRRGRNRSPDPYGAGFHATDVDVPPLFPLRKRAAGTTRDDRDIVPPTDEFGGEFRDVGLDAPDMRLKPRADLDDPQGGRSVDAAAGGDDAPRDRPGADERLLPDDRPDVD